MLGREGENSYIVEITPGHNQRAHRSQLAPRAYGVFDTKPYPLYYFSGRAPEVGVGPEEYVIDKVLEVKKKDGQIQALVRWEGYGKDPTWEPLEKLFPPGGYEALQRAKLLS